MRTMWKRNVTVQSTWSSKPYLFNCSSIISFKEKPNHAHALGNCLKNQKFATVRLIYLHMIVMDTLCLGTSQQLDYLTEISTWLSNRDINLIVFVGNLDAWILITLRNGCLIKRTTHSSMSNCRFASDPATLVSLYQGIAGEHSSFCNKSLTNLDIQQQLYISCTHRDLQRHWETQRQ